MYVRVVEIKNEKGSRVRICAVNKI